MDEHRLFNNGTAEMARVAVSPELDAWTPDDDPAQPTGPRTDESAERVSRFQKSDYKAPGQNAAQKNASHLNAPYQNRSGIGSNGDGNYHPPPYSEDAEKGAICSMLLAPGETVGFIDPKAFFIPAHRIFHDIICQWSEPDKSVDFIWLVERLIKEGQLDEVGGRYSVSELFSFVPTPANFRHYVGIVQEKFALRQVIAACEKAVRQCRDHIADPGLIIEEAKAAIAKASVKGNQRLNALLEATLSGAEFNAIQITPRTPIIKDWFMEGDLGFAYAYRGSGKTWFILNVSSALANGSECGPWQVLGEWPVLYVDGEMMSDDIQQRIRALNGGEIPTNLHVLNHEILYQKSEMVLNFANLADQQLILQVCLKKKIRVLVLDNLGCLFTGVKENDADEWEKVLPWLLELRRHKIAVIIIHHTGVDPSRMRGTTKREDPAAFSIRLEDKKEDFSVPGARFVTRFRKYRGREMILDYEWDFRPHDDKVLVTHKEANRADIVLQWVRDGLNSCSEIAREMGVSNGQVSKIATRLIREGKLTKNNRGYQVVEVEP
jgi:hypothetical protein